MITLSDHHSPSKIIHTEHLTCHQSVSYLIIINIWLLSTKGPFYYTIIMHNSIIFFPLVVTIFISLIIFPSTTYSFCYHIPIYDNTYTITLYIHITIKYITTIMYLLNPPTMQYFHQSLIHSTPLLNLHVSTTTS